MKKISENYGKHLFSGQLVVAVHLALKRLANINAPNNVTIELCMRTGEPHFDNKLRCQIAQVIFL